MGPLHNIPTWRQRKHVEDREWGKDSHSQQSKAHGSGATANEARGLGCREHHPDVLWQQMPEATTQRDGRGGGRGRCSFNHYLRSKQQAGLHLPKPWWTNCPNVSAGWYVAFIYGLISDTMDQLSVPVPAFLFLRSVQEPISRERQRESPDTVNLALEWNTGPKERPRDQKLNKPTLLSLTLCFPSD